MNNRNLESEIDESAAKICCRTCAFMEKVNGFNNFRFLACLRFPPSAYHPESPYDKYTGAKFPIVQGYYVCGEWHQAAHEGKGSRNIRNLKRARKYAALKPPATIEGKL
jgi:hypothetical protein